MSYLTPIPDAEIQQVGQAFFNLYDQNKPEIDSLFNTIKVCLAGVAPASNDYLKYLMLTPDCFEHEYLFSRSIRDLYSATLGDTGLMAKVLYIGWYYRMTLLAMGSLGAKKAVEYIRNKTGEQVTVMVTGTIFNTYLDSVIRFRIQHANSSDPFASRYSGFELYGPSWKDILETCIYSTGGEESLMRLEALVGFNVFDKSDVNIYKQDDKPLPDLGKYVKKYFIDKIKQIVAAK